MVLGYAAEPSPSDRQQLELLNSRFEREYTFGREGELYLTATARDSRAPPRADMGGSVGAAIRHRLSRAAMIPTDRLRSRLCVLLALGTLRWLRVRLDSSGYWAIP